jgi:ParB family chromosome partitioning protein
MSKNKALGMGLAALIGNSNYNKRVIIDPPTQKATQSDLTYLEIEKLQAGIYQPRKNFKEESLSELANSILENGVISPIIIRLVGNQYEIIAGERRWRAAKLAGLKQVPVIIKNIDDQKVLEISIVENVQRQDLNAIEEAEAIERLISEFSYSHEKVAASIGKSRSHVSNILRLLKLPKEVQEMIASEKISMSHARAIINSDQDPIVLVNKIIEKNLSVRDIENLVRKTPEKSVKKPQASKNNNKDQELIELEQSVANELGLQVEINYDAENKGNISINFSNLEQLDRVIQLLSNNAI